MCPRRVQPLDLLRKFLILGLCPFFYGAATRLRLSMRLYKAYLHNPLAYQKPPVYIYIGSR